jgi:hypothetical protein
MESVTREQLRELFSQAGEVTKVDIPDGGRSMVSGLIMGCSCCCCFWCFSQLLAYDVGFPGVLVVVVVVVPFASAWFTLVVKPGVAVVPGRRGDQGGHTRRGTQHGEWRHDLN